jgi:hypothetical protein
MTKIGSTVPHATRLGASRGLVAVAIVCAVIPGYAQPKGPPAPPPPKAAPAAAPKAPIAPPPKAAAPPAAPKAPTAPAPAPKALPPWAQPKGGPPAAPPGATPAAGEDADRQKARELWALARERHTKGDFAGALEAALGAEKLVPAPTITVEVGRAYVSLGRLVEGREALLRAASHPPAPGEPGQFAGAREEAAALAAAAAERIPTLAIEVRTAAGPLSKDTPATVLVAGTPPASQPLALNPGRYEIVARAHGYAEARTTVDLKERERRVETITLQGPPAAPPPAPPAEPSGEPFPRLTVGLVTGGVGAASLALFGVFGGLALAKKSELDDACPNRHCPSAELGDAADDGETFRTLSNVFLVVGVVGVVAGGGLVAWHFFDPPEEGDVPAALVVRPGSLAVTGRF